MSDAAPPVPTPDARPFAARMTRAPLVQDAAAARIAAEAFADLAPELRDLLAGAASCSPYLAALMAREGAWLRAALAAPEAALAAELGQAAALSRADLEQGLRQAKRRLALLTALADLGGVWSLGEVTGALTALADAAVGACLGGLVGHEISRGKIPGAGPQDGADCAGLFALAMGKTGAGELNYSSDIDLICLYDETRFAAGDRAEARAGFIRAVRRMTQILSDSGPGGYVFRTDLRLRPDASVTPVVLSMAAAELYYESEGRTWERAAYIKARPCAGDTVAGARFLAALTPFVWRRHLDFAAIEDAHAMRLKIRDHKGLNGPIAVPGHNLKLGQGGIREIEFFTQTRQLIAGGRDPRLRARTTLGGLAALAQTGWVPPEVATALGDHYTALRELEHRVQMVADAQTHLMPATPEGIERIARMCGEGDTGRFVRRLRDRLVAVEEMTGGFFAPETPRRPRPQTSARQAEIIARWRAYPALRSERAAAIFARLEPEILARMARAASPDEALLNFDGFLMRLPAGVQLFSLFEANPSLVDLIVDICGTAPGLSAYLSRHAGVLDAVIGGSFFAPWPGKAALGEDLARRLAGAADYEGRLDAARIWQKEWHFRVGVHHLRGLIDAQEAARQYADLAGAVLGALWPAVGAEFARRHGPPPGRGAVVVGMGSLGAERLNAASDLDLLVIYDAGAETESAGPKPLPAQSYYARLTQTLVTALTAQTAEGRLYEVDMRLRPSGRKGPLATSLAAFAAYQRQEAWTWEHLALTRARVVAGPEPLAAQVEAVRAGVLAEVGARAGIMADLAQMRARIFAAKPVDGAWEAKIGPGRMQDIELLAQSFALRLGAPARQMEGQLRLGARGGFLSAAEGARLAAAFRFLWRLQAGGRLLSDRPLDMEALGEGGRAFLLRETDCADLRSLADKLAASVADVVEIVDRALGAPSPGEVG